ncbi:MAG: exopolyphosphatase [Gammaproteobacteria bacterium]|nr:exopolyphosphatase [Gammaproteobacteria bacterium]
MPNIFAAIDLGSNSFHMIVGRHEDGQIIILDRLREMVRLASGLDEKNNITPEMMKTALECLSRFGERIAHLHADVVRIVGTNTLRQAKNSRTFMRKAEKLLGQPIEIISGIEEARLLYSGVAHNIDSDDTRRLVVDIGGGSTEIIIGERYRTISLESLYMGCVNTTKRFFADGKISKKRVKKALMYSMTELEPYIKSYNNLGWENTIGASGTIRAIEKITREENLADFGITQKSLTYIMEHVIKAGDIDNIDLKGLKNERKPVIIGGIVVLQSIFDAFNIKLMRVSDGALREGILYDLIGRNQNNDSRSESIEKFAERFVIDRRHGTQVKNTAIELYQQAEKEWFSKTPEALKYCQWAATLHEVGLSIAHNQYHRHGEYMVSNADLMGFSKENRPCWQP